MKFAYFYLIIKQLNKVSAEIPGCKEQERKSKLNTRDLIPQTVLGQEPSFINN